MSPASETDPRLLAIAQHFTPEKIHTITPLGNGNINTTYLATTRHTPPTKFVLQRINNQVFHQPKQVIQNMVTLTNHLQKTPPPANRRWENPQILPTQSGQNHWQDENDQYWRAITFIENAHVLDAIQNTAHAKEIGHGLATFHKLISTLNTDTLTDTLPGFHITPTYLAAYEQVITTSERCDTQNPLIRNCLEIIDQRKDWAHVLENAKAAGHLQLRPIHGDPKVNNIMLDGTGQAVSLIDLDTLKPGLIHYDIGDCLRSGCNPLGEETENWQAVTFDTDLAKAMLEGYLTASKTFLTPSDYDYLYDAIRLITFELGLRFFTDYLAGDTYFKVTHPTHNLTRALVQFKLTESIEAQADTLKAIIQALR